MNLKFDAAVFSVVYAVSKVLKKLFAYDEPDPRGPVRDDDLLMRKIPDKCALEQTAEKVQRCVEKYLEHDRLREFGSNREFWQSVLDKLIRYDGYPRCALEVWIPSKTIMGVLQAIQSQNSGLLSDGVFFDFVLDNCQVKKDFSIMFPLFSSMIRSHPARLRAAVVADPIIYGKIPLDSRLSDPVLALTAVKADGANLKHVPAELKTKEVCFAALRSYELSWGCAMVLKGWRATEVAAYVPEKIKDLPAYKMEFAPDSSYYVSVEAMPTDKFKNRRDSEIEEEDEPERSEESEPRRYREEMKSIAKELRERKERFREARNRNREWNLDLKLPVIDKELELKMGLNLPSLGLCCRDWTEAKWEKVKETLDRVFQEEMEAWADVEIGEAIHRLSSDDEEEMCDVAITKGAFGGDHDAEFCEGCREFACDDCEPAANVVNVSFRSGVQWNVELSKRKILEKLAETYSGGTISESSASLDSDDESGPAYEPPIKREKKSGGDAKSKSKKPKSLSIKIPADFNDFYSGISVRDSGFWSRPLALSSVQDIMRIYDFLIETVKNYYKESTGNTVADCSDSFHRNSETSDGGPVEDCYFEQPMVSKGKAALSKFLLKHLGLPLAYDREIDAASHVSNSRGHKSIFAVLCKRRTVQGAGAKLYHMASNFGESDLPGGDPDGVELKLFLYAAGPGDSVNSEGHDDESDEESTGTVEDLWSKLGDGAEITVSLSKDQIGVFDSDYYTK